MDTRGFKLCAAAVGILPVTAGCTDRAPQEHPNILFILSDDCVSTPSWEFYDLRTDPHENRNQYGNPAYAEVIGAMKREMLELHRQYKDTDEGSARMRKIMETHYAPESAKH